MLCYIYVSITNRVFTFVPWHRAIDTVSRTNIPARKASKVVVSFQGLACAQPSKIEHEDERKEISTYLGFHRPELSYGIFRRWDDVARRERQQPGHERERENYPSSLPLACIFSSSFSSFLFFVLANFDDFPRQSSMVVIFQSRRAYKDSWVGSCLWSIWGSSSQGYSWLHNYRNKNLWMNRWIFWFPLFNLFIM